jgi:hypothetical protein
MKTDIWGMDENLAEDSYTFQAAWFCSRPTWLAPIPTM